MSEGYGLTPVEAYQYYVSLKTHFGGAKYDFTKYGIKGIQVSGYDNRKDKYYFERISRKWTKNEIVPLLVSSFLVDPATYSADLLERDAKDRYLAYIKTMTNIYRTFESDIKGLAKFAKDNDLTIGDLFSVKDGQHPITFRMYLQSLISIETYVIMDSYIKFFDVYDKKLSGDYIWTDIHSIKLRKYKPFGRFNYDKFLLVMKRYMHER